MEDRLTALLAPVMEATGLEFWSLQLVREGGRQVLRVLIDRPDGVTDDDCRRASAAVSAALDAVDPIAGPYTLEVASPGVDRALRKPDDYARFAGSTARLRLKQPLEGRGGAARRRGRGGAGRGRPGDAARAVPHDQRGPAHLERLRQVGRRDCRRGAREEA
jgi:ribosome maturation factor RimP